MCLNETCVYVEVLIGKLPFQNVLKQRNALSPLLFNLKRPGKVVESESKLDSSTAALC
jgi:hypothetical protein